MPDTSPAYRAAKEADTFTDVDGSTRCRGCHLYPEQCTCHADHPVRTILAGTGLALPLAARAAGKEDV